MTRRPEAYHRKVLAGADGRNDVAGVSDRVVFKQEGLDRPAAVRLRTAQEPARSLLRSGRDRWRQWPRAKPPSGATFVSALTRPTAPQSEPHAGAAVCQGQAAGASIRITKSVTLEAGSSTWKSPTCSKACRTDRPLHFAVEFNFAGLPSGADDRYFYGDDRQRFGQLGTRLDLPTPTSWAWSTSGWASTSAWRFLAPRGIWTFPVETVSQSEGGFELVHQSVAVMPHWIVQGDADGRWSVVMNLAIDTTAAQSNGTTGRSAIDLRAIELRRNLTCPTRGWHSGYNTAS